MVLPSALIKSPSIDYTYLRRYGAMPLRSDLSSLPNPFDTLIDSYLENKVGIAEHFIPIALARQLRDRLIRLDEEEMLMEAGTGNEELRTHTGLVRKDRIYWLDSSHGDSIENEFLALIDEFVLHLNSTCYTGITGYEFHFTLYRKGAFYRRHLDQFRNDQSRQYSMIIYLNSDWEDADGGQLQIYGSGHTTTVSPVSGKSIFFKSSELEHEVMTTNRSRMSINGWLKQ